MDEKYRRDKAPAEQAIDQFRILNNENECIQKERITNGTQNKTTSTAKCRRIHSDAEQEGINWKQQRTKALHSSIKSKIQKTLDSSYRFSFISSR
jgi:predicted amino acid dehydrogenase